jgi:hypothetical protein
LADRPALADSADRRRPPGMAARHDADTAFA